MLLEFYSDKTYFNYSLVMNMNDYQWETRHDFIQYIFPDIIKSSYNTNAPCLTMSQILKFRRNKFYSKRLLKAFKRFLYHLGLKIHKKRIIIDNPLKVQMRIKTPNHNQLRITRAIRSLRILGLNSYAMMFYKCLSKIRLYQSNDYWYHAANDKIYLKKNVL
jgi:hypothetical protein